jgi:hypothetical protein
MTTDTITAKTIEPNTFDRTVAELKQGVEFSTKANAEASEKTINAAKDFVAFNQASLEALTQASKIFAAEAQDLARQAIASNQAAFDEILSGVRALVAAKSVKENIELQASLSRAAATWTVTEGSRFAQASIALVEKASAPLIARATAAAETISALKA